MSSVAINRYGSLYYASENVRGAVPLEATGDLPASVQNDPVRRFAIGPVAEHSWWQGERADLDIRRGPLKSPQDYVAAIGTRELNWLVKYAVPKPDDDPFAPTGTQNCPASHIALLERYLQVAPCLLPSDQPDLIASLLWHTDLHAANIFIDPETNRISSIIDWQGIFAAPLITQARHPKLVDYNGEHILENPPGNDDLEPDEKRRVRDKWSRSIVLYNYEHTLAKEVPLVYRLFHFPNVRTRCETIMFASNTWDDDDGIIPFRETLIRIEKYWGELEINVPCPYHFTEDELRVHREEGKGWNSVQDFWQSLSPFVSPDGWTANEDYENAIALFKDMLDQALEGKEGKEREEFLKEKQWMDIPSVKQGGSD